MTSEVRGPAPGYYLRIAVVIGTMALLTSFLRVVFGRTPVVDTLIHGFVYSLSIGPLASVALPFVRHRVRAAGRVTEWALTLAAILVVAATGAFIAHLILGAIGLSYGQPLFVRFRRSFEMNLLITSIIGIAVTLYESQRARVDALTLELRTKELEREREHKMALEARLSSLESRLHPHFLFNTLNAISELIHENPARAEETVERLAKLLRAALDATGRGTVPLAQEMEIVADYLEIEKTRFGDRLRYVFSVTPEAATCELPPLAVQTLVENSIKHAIAPRPRGGQIRVEAQTHDGRLTVGVWDDGPGFAISAAVPGHGLENLQSRLAARFGESATLSVARRDDGTIVAFSLPRNSGSA
jgi:two-component system, LytTR family, sensor histidine kinase AlgZ